MARVRVSKPGAAIVRLYDPIATLGMANRPSCDVVALTPATVTTAPGTGALSFSSSPTKPVKDAVVGAGGGGGEAGGVGVVGAVVVAPGPPPHAQASNTRPQTSSLVVDFLSGRGNEVICSTVGDAEQNVRRAFADSHLCLTEGRVISLSSEVLGGADVRTLLLPRTATHARRIDQRDATVTRP